MPKQAYAFAQSVHGLIMVLEGLIALPADASSWSQARNNCQGWQADPSTIFFVDQTEALANPVLVAALERKRALVAAKIHAQYPEQEAELQAVQARLRQLGMLP